MTSAHGDMTNLPTAARPVAYALPMGKAGRGKAIRLRLVALTFPTGRHFLMKYDFPIRSPKHAEFCRSEAERRYGGRIVKDKHGMLLVQDPSGLRHTDAVLRALSLYAMGRK